MPASVYNTNAIEKVSLSERMYQFSQNTFGLLGIARAEAYRTAKIFELENTETLTKRKQKQIVLEGLRDCTLILRFGEQEEDMF